MKRILFAATLLMAVGAYAQVDEFDGVLHVTHGYTTDASGVRHSLVGENIPFHGSRIHAWKRFPTGSVEVRKPPRPLGGPDALVYQNDNAADYYYSGFSMPSALDDVALTSAAPGARWMSMSMGLNFNDSDPDQYFFIRWIGYSSYVSGRGAGVSAFDSPALDFGGTMNLYLVNPFIDVPGAFKLTFNLSGTSQPITFPQTQMYFAQQFRYYDGTQNGPFSDIIDSVFSGVGVTVGSSTDIFWYDNDPVGPDGIYDETENDQFDPPHLANLLLVIDAQQTGTTDTRVPSGFSYLRGSATSGTLSDLWDSDNFYVTSIPGVVFAFTDPPIQMVFTSTALATNATALRFSLESRAATASIQQKISLWNYSTSQWVEVDSRFASTSDAIVEVAAPSSPSQFINQTTREIKTRVTWKSTAVVFAWPWTTKVDRAVWLVTRP